MVPGEYPLLQRCWNYYLSVFVTYQFTDGAASNKRAESEIVFLIYSSYKFIEDGDGITNEIEVTTLIQPWEGPAFDSDNTGVWTVWFPTIEGTSAEQAIQRFKATQNFADAHCKE
mmetsp:Transcript_8527/g.23902  ORF Transcript_8527/g.23902 Transcript_8527/m.23902 type:complete len:115 (-) Transcript_8527:1697-2041(-)